MYERDIYCAQLNETSTIIGSRSQNRGFPIHKFSVEESQSENWKIVVVYNQCFQHWCQIRNISHCEVFYSFFVSAQVPAKVRVLEYMQEKVAFDNKNSQSMVSAELLRPTSRVAKQYWPDCPHHHFQIRRWFAALSHRKKAPSLRRRTLSGDVREVRNEIL